MKWSWLALIAAVALVFVLLAQDGPAAHTGSFPVEVIGPEGQILARNVTVVDGTVYRVLAAALALEGLPHTAEGAGESLFVTSIAGHANSGAGGWCFDVFDGEWIRPALGAGAYGLQPGQATRWVYEGDGCGALS